MSGEDYMTRNFTICTPHQILSGLSDQDERDRRGMRFVWGTGRVHTGFWWERDHFEDRDVDGRVMKNGFSKR